MVTNDQDARAVGVPSGWADPSVAADEGPLLRRWLPLLVWLACLLVAVVLLRWLGGGRLGTPSLGDPGAWASWVRDGDPLTVTMGSLRLVALGLAWYLTGVTSVSVVARLLDATSLVRVADALSVGPVRVLVQQAMGVGLAASVLATAVPSAPATSRVDAAPAGEVAVMTPLEPYEATAPSGLALRDEAVLPEARTAPDATAPDATAPDATAAAASAAAPVPAPDPVARPVLADHVGMTFVAPPNQATTVPDGMRERRILAGDHFWSIAAEEVERQLGRPGTEDEVLDHWETLLVVNADRLVVAGNADLLVPGQVIVLPDVAEVAR